MTCPGSSTLTYIATCTNSGLWDHSLLVNVCAGTGVSLDLATQPPSIAPPATAPPSPPVSIMSTMTCPFLPGFMEADDATKTYPEGVVYQMICSNGGGRFAATCQNGAWVYRINSCPGIVTSPPPTTTTTTTPSTVPLGKSDEIYELTFVLLSLMPLMFIVSSQVRRSLIVTGRYDMLLPLRLRNRASQLAGNIWCGTYIYGSYTINRRGGYSYSMFSKCKSTYNPAWV